VSEFPTNLCSFVIRQNRQILTLRADHITRIIENRAIMRILGYKRIK
jgi:hypothetical protein